MGIARRLTIDDFDIPTGELVLGLPTSIVLGPGETSELLSFGLVDPEKYILALADAAFTSTPEDLFNLANATIFVPLPSHLALLGIGLLTLWFARRLLTP